MEVRQQLWTPDAGWHAGLDDGAWKEASLVFAFGGRDHLSGSDWFAETRRKFPNACIVSGSTAGEILDTRVYDDSLCVTALRFEDATFRTATTRVTDMAKSYEAGQQLARDLASPGLRHLFVLAIGHDINGTELARGLRETLPSDVAATGGLAGDGARMVQTVVGLDGPPCIDQVVALGFYGAGLRIGYGSLGGWDAFGPERLVTRSKGNVLFDLDGTPALDLYKTYLGDRAAELPTSSLEFPLSLRLPSEEKALVRTALAIDDAAKSLTFAGDIPEGRYVRFMKANFERLIDGAMGAAQQCRNGAGGDAAQLALLVSCVGRKLVLRQRIEEEVENVREVLGPGVPLAGFYSYGEICPHRDAVQCELHNQTMTITTFGEA